MGRILKIALGMIIALAGLVLAFISILAHLEHGVHKLTMPGRYEIALSTGGYQIWYFWLWPSKGIETDPHHPKLLFLNDKHEIAIPGLETPGPHRSTLTIDSTQNYTEERVESFKGDYSMFQRNQGCLVYDITVKQAGNYIVSSDDKAVIVLVPKSSSYEFFEGPEDFWGSADDWNFEPAITSSRK